MTLADIGSGAVTGGTIGSTLSPILGPFGPLLGALLGATAGGISGLFSGNKETPRQTQQQELIDQLLASLGNNGPFSDLFNTDEAAFQKSFVDPAKSLFDNQIAPQIQQQYIASGQQRGTGMEGQLTRAGVDLDQMLNQNYMQFQQQGQNRQMSAIDRILGSGAGAPAKQSGFERFMGGVAGYGTGEAFPKMLELAFDRNRAGNTARAGYTS